MIIDPGLAFGTGEHPTTRLCLQWLHQVVSPGDKMLDYGTGSGILSIAALKVSAVLDLLKFPLSIVRGSFKSQFTNEQMGGAHAIGVDIDPAAISASEYNASLNNLKPDTLQVYVASADGEDPVPKDSTDFDVVVANILLNPLVELAGRITGYCKPGGFVGVSGILVEQVGFLFICIKDQHVVFVYSGLISVVAQCRSIKLRKLTRSIWKIWPLRMTTVGHVLVVGRKAVFIQIY